ncbi:MAG: nucleotide pyrophosphohydrolase [Thermogutta sp.]
MSTHPPADDSTTVADLRRLVDDFVSARDWHRFHSPKNLAMALAIEAAELMEHFQWLTPEQSRRIADQPERRDAAAEELADVVCYALAMANELGIDVAAAVVEKMKKNVAKYPAEKYQGYFGPDDPALSGDL